MHEEIEIIDVDISLMFESWSLDIHIMVGVKRSLIEDNDPLYGDCDDLFFFCD